VLGSRPASAVAPGTPDSTCLAAANYIQVLESFPGASAPVSRAARQAWAVINADERRGNTFCRRP
jgi:hypothetical protein